MSVLPDPVALDDPPGQPDAVLAVAADARSAARLLQELSDQVGRAHVPGWHSEDGRTAADRGTSISRLAADSADSLLRAAARLVEHAEVWQAVRAGLVGLRSEQEQDEAAARRRVAAPVDPLDPFGPSVDDVLGAWVAAEQRRAAERHRLLGLLEDDAAHTGRVLRACCAVVGSVGGRGRLGRELVHLAALLPAWAAPQLTARGHHLAGVLGRGPTAGAEEAAAEAVGLAGEPAFASAFLGALGVEGVRRLLLDMDHVELGEGSAVAAVLAAALGAAAVLPRHDRRVADVLSTRYVSSRDHSTIADQVARGLAIVVTTGAQYGRLPDSRTIGAWARQMTAREADHGLIRDRLGFLADDAVEPDPVLALATVIASRGDATAAGELLADRSQWTALLARHWDDDGTAFAGMVNALAQAPGTDAQVALRSGLEALGDGLQDGHPDGWTPYRATADTVAPALGRALAAHVGTITGLLAEVADSCPPPDRLAALHGLGYVTIDREAAEAVGKGLRAWTGRPTPALTGGGEAVLVAVPAAFLAVRHYGQRLEFSLDSHVRKEQAERHQRRWDLTIGLLVDVVMNTVGKRVPAAEPLVAAAEDAVQGWVGADGTWNNGRDDGTRFTATDAARLVTAGAGDRGQDGLRHVARAGAEIFLRAQAALGEPVIAVPEEDGIPVDGLGDLVGERRRGRSGGLGSPPASGASPQDRPGG